MKTILSCVLMRNINIDTFIQKQFQTFNIYFPGMKANSRITIRPNLGRICTMIKKVIQYLYIKSNQRTHSI